MTGTNECISTALTVMQLIHFQVMCQQNLLSLQSWTSPIISTAADQRVNLEDVDSIVSHIFSVRTSQFSLMKSELETGNPVLICSEYRQHDILRKCRTFFKLFKLNFFPQHLRSLKQMSILPIHQDTNKAMHSEAVSAMNRPHAMHYQNALVYNMWTSTMLNSLFASSV